MDASQRLELNQAVVGYLQSQIGETATAPIASALCVETVPEDMANRLEAKWKALVYLSQKIHALERQLQERPAASGLAGPAGAASGPPGLPGLARLTLEEHRQPVTCVGVHPKWNVVASGCEDGSIKIWNTETGERELTLKAHTRGVTALDFGRVLVSCSSDLLIRVFDPENDYAAVKTLAGHEHTVSCVRLFNNDEQVASCSRDTTVRVWDLQTGYCTQVIKSHADWVRTLSVFNGGLVSAGRDQSLVLTVFDGKGGRSHAMHGHQHVIECCATAPAAAHENLAAIAGFKSPEFFATGSRDKTIILWSCKQAVATLVGHDNWVRGLYFEPTGRFLYSCSDDKTVRVWDLANNAKLYKVVRAHDHFVSSIAGNGRVTVTGSVDTRVRVW